MKITEEAQIIWGYFFPRLSYICIHFDQKWVGLHFGRIFHKLNWDRCYDFLNIFAEKFSKKLEFLTQNKAKLCKILIITLVYEKNANFFAENCQKSQKIVIITSTPGRPA
jgi:hypothetical protein